MKTQLHQFFRRTFALVLLLGCLGASFSAFGQLDPGSHTLVQNGVQVGEIFVPDRVAGQSLYAEHWVLYPNYVYPNAQNGMKTEIVPSAHKQYLNESEFFARAPFGGGFRYVHVTSNDSTRLPGRP